MRVLIGLAALVASVNAQATVSLAGNAQGSSAAQATGFAGTTAVSSIQVYQSVLFGTAPNVNPALTSQSSSCPGSCTYLNTGNWAITIPYATSSLVFSFYQSNYVAQLAHRWSPNYPSPAVNFPGHGLSASSYTCDTCTNPSGTGTPITCSTAVGTGPGTAPSPTLGFNCASFQRIYTFSNLQANFVSSFAVEVWDNNQNPNPNTSSYSFSVTRPPPPIIGDPQITGMQGQDFQVHGIPDEIFNMITYPNLQVNARFVYLSSAECIDNYTACFAHPGTYISEEGIRLGSDKIHVRAGSAKKGLSVSVNGQKVSSGSQKVKLGSVELVNHRRVVVKTPIMSITITNSDKFLNQETALFDHKLLALGSERRVLGDNEQFHPEVPLHGLQGQTWRNVEYPSGLDYEGSISDYHVTDGNLFGTSFAFNQFTQ